MATRAYRDRKRASWIGNENLSATRAIVYTRSSDDLAIPLNAFVAGNEFNQDLPPDGKKVNKITCRGLVLEQEPTKTDKVTFNGRDFTVREWDKLGELYMVMAENAKRNKVTSRSFK